jgi:hypothetical protein
LTLWADSARSTPPRDTREPHRDEAHFDATAPPQGATASIYLHTDVEMHKQAGMRQNRRIAAAIAKAEHDSQPIRENVRTLKQASA